METPGDEEEVYIEIPNRAKVAVLNHSDVKNRELIYALQTEIVLRWEDKYNFTSFFSDNEIMLDFKGKLSTENLLKVFTKKFLLQLQKEGFKIKFWQ